MMKSCEQFGIVILKQFFLLFTAVSSFGAFVVSPVGNDSQIGSVGQPWKTINYGASMLQAGDTLLVRGGVYSEKVRIAVSGSATGGHIVIMAYPRENPVLDGSLLSPSGREGLIHIANQSYLVVSGFELRNFRSSGNPTPVGICLEGNTHHVDILNNNIHHIENNKSGTANVGAHGIGVFGTTSQGIHHLRLVGNEISSCILMSSEAFVLNGNVSNFEVLDNFVHDNNNIGFDFIGFEGECSCADDYVRDGLVQGNRAVNNRSDLANSWYGGDASAGGFYVDGGSNIVFDGNLSTGNNLGIEVASENAGRTTRAITLRNNIVTTNTEVGIAIGGYAQNRGAADSISIVNNSLYKNKGWGNEIVLQYNISNLQVANNIIWAASGDPVEFVNAQDIQSGWSDNLYFGGTVEGPGGLGSRMDPLWGNPDAGDFNLGIGSPAIDQGNNFVPELVGAVDFAGNQRIVETQIDLGALEFLSGPVSRVGESMFAPILGESTYLKVRFGSRLYLFKGEGSPLALHVITLDGRRFLQRIDGLGVLEFPEIKGVGILFAGVEFTGGFRWQIVTFVP